MKFDKVLNESYPRYKIKYTGTRDNYKIHDKNPYILVLDQHYNVDGNGMSILALNLNYYNGDKKALINKINKFDNSIGFRGFETKLKLKKIIKKYSENYEANKRKERYDALMREFPFLQKYIRRYKIQGIDSKKRVLLK